MFSLDFMIAFQTGDLEFVICYNVANSCRDDFVATYLKRCLYNKQEAQEAPATGRLL